LSTDHAPADDEVMTITRSPRTGSALRAVALTTATMVSSALVGLPTLPAFAGDESRASAPGGGCVSNAQYYRLGIGQTVRYVRVTAGDSAQMTMRRWQSSGNAYQERRYAMCTPRDEQHSVLTTRFQHYRGQWRALIVDTYIGPER
jgi:hypothetical protein